MSAATGAVTRARAAQAGERPDRVDPRRPGIARHVPQPGGTERLERIRRAGARLHEIVLVAGARQDRDALLARGQLLRSVFASLGADASVRLDPGPGDDPAARRCLQALAETIARGGGDVVSTCEASDPMPQANGGPR